MDKPAGKTELRILLLEDVPTDAELVEDALREAGLSFTAQRVDTREAFIQALEEFKPDVVLADYKLPAFDGGAALKIIRQQYPSVPVVMVTGAVGDEMAIELLKMGAMDYVLKDRMARLGPAVLHVISEMQDIRARKAAEQALRQSEEQFRSVFKNVKDVILTLSIDGTLMMLNPAFEQITGWTCTEWLGKSFSSLVHPDDLPNALHLLQRASRGEALPVFELRILKKIGGYVVGEITLAPLLHDGANAYLLGTARDITERKQVEAKLAESEQHFRAVAQTANDAIITIDGAGSIVGWNAAAQRLFGYTEAEIMRQPLTLLMPERFRNLHNAGLARVMAGGAPHVIGKTIELAGLRKDGSEFPLELSLAQWQAADGQFFTGIIRDITERKQAEEEIKKQSRLLDLVFANSQESIVLLDKDYNFIKVSESYAKSCKRDVSEFKGHNHFEFFPSSLKDEFDEALSKNIIYSRSDRPFSFPDHPEWGVTYWDVGMVPIRDAENNIELLLFTLRDVTKRCQAEARVQKLTRLYATLSQTNEVIVRTTSREELFRNICERAVIHGKFIMAWVGLVDEATRTVRPLCHYGAEQGYLTGIVISTDDVPEGRGPTGAAIRENRISYVNDYTTDERTLPWREAARMHGFRGAAGLPLRFRNTVIGALTLYVDEPDFFDADHLKLFEEMVADIGFALDNIAREAERKQAESKLAEQLDELRRWHDATLGREMRILDLKHEVNELLVQAGKPPRYHSAE